MAMSESSADSAGQPDDYSSADRVAQLEEMLDYAHDEIVELEERLDEVEATYESKLEAQQQTIRDLKRRVNEIDERTDLLKVVETADQTDGQQRSAALLQHLKRQAEREADRGRSAKVSVTHSETLDALHYPDVHRTAIYHDWDRCVRWIDDRDVCWTGERNGNKRLFLDLETVDESVISHAISQRGGKA